MHGTQLHSSGLADHVVAISHMD